MHFIPLALLFFFSTIHAQDRIVCPRIQSTDSNTYLESSDEKKDFWEISGLGFSPTKVGPSGQPLFYAINDGGGGRRFGIFDSFTGQRLLSLRLPRESPLNIDYEGLTVGSCGIDPGDCIYIADVGDNPARNSNGTRTGDSRDGRLGYSIYKIQEPDINQYEDNDIIPDSTITTLWFNYFHSSSPTRYADCEAVFLDNVGWGEGGAIGDFYILTKWEDYDEEPANTLNRLFKIPTNVWAEAKNDGNFTFSPEAVGDYDNGIDSNGLMGLMWTRGEMSLDGTLIALGDYYYQYLFLRCPGMSVAEALAVEGTAYCRRWEIEYWDSQFETIAFSPDKSRTLEISECWGSSCSPDPPMVWTILDYTYDEGSKMAACPLEASVGNTTDEVDPSPGPSSMPVTDVSPTTQTTPTDLPTIASTNASDETSPAMNVDSRIVAAAGFSVLMTILFL